MPEVKQGSRMNEPPGEILESDGHRIIVSEETNRRWLEQEIESCRAVEPELRAKVAEAEGQLSEAEGERWALEKELRDA